MWALKLAFAGTENLIWHWGIGVGLIILILVAEYFSGMIPVLGPALAKFRQDLLWVAVGIAVFLAGEYVGAKDIASRYLAKEAVVGQEVQSVVTKAAKPTKAKDRWDTNQ